MIGHAHMGMWIIGLIFAGIGWLVQSQLKNKFAKYSKTTLLKGLSGREVAERMLKDNMIYDVKVISVAGQLTDHYNPANKTVNLSHDVYHGRSTASAAVAAHECGHAVQHATAYAMLGLRAKLVPIVNIAGTVMPFILMFGVLLLSRVPGLLVIAIAAQAIITLFTLVTLPVEFDASRRALIWIKSTNTAVGHEYDEAKDALKWAAMTYLVSALAAVTQLIYLILKYTGNRR
jgi:Zn-dependent membrane protease YugP